MDPTPRVNRANIQNYVGKTVRFVGKVLGTNPGNGSADMESSDGQRIHVQLVTPASQFTQQIVEIVGTVNPDLSITEMLTTPFSPNFGMNNLCINKQIWKITTIWLISQVSFPICSNS